MSGFVFFDLRARPLSLTGEIMPGCYYQFFESGTTTPTDVFSDGDLTTPLSNPVVADSDGRFPVIYLDPAVVYRVQLYDALDVLQYDADPVHAFSSIPPGTVIPFFGTAEERDAVYPPSLFAVCDGTNGTPDLVGRFPKGVDGGESAGDTGGDSTVTTTAAGAHDHGGAVSSESLSVAQMPEHSHGASGTSSSAGAVDENFHGGNMYGFPGVYGASGGTISYRQEDSFDNELIEPIGDGDPHAHDIEAVADHTHDVDAMPPWCALWFLMRLP